MNPREYEALYRTEDRHWWFVGVRREIAAELARAGSGIARWLDAGSGTGGILANLRLPGSPAAFGVEISPEGVAFSKSRGLRRLARASVSQLPFPDAAFDLVTSIDVLCHRGVEEPRALAEAYRCLREGGRLILQVPAFNWLRSEHDDAVWTSRRYCRREVGDLLTEAGFAVEAIFYRVALLFPAAALRRLFARRSGPEKVARSEVRPASPAANALFGGILRLESALAALGLRLPFGLSVFAVARKPRAAARASR
jgi:SAM-dependent methyltransferase